MHQKEDDYSNDASENISSTKEADLDEEGLKKDGYDVIIVGTGLTQSILASALTRVGKSVLHCDENDFYGDLDAVMSLNELLEWVNSRMKKGENSNSRDKNDGNNSNSVIELKSSYNSLTIDSFSAATVQDITLEIGMKVATSYGYGTIVGLPAETIFGMQSVQVKLVNWNLANGKSPIVYFGINNFRDMVSTSRDLKSDGHIVPLKYLHYEKYVLSQTRRYAFDLSPALLYAHGLAVTGVIDSGVSDYCEFKSLLGLFLLMKKEGRGNCSELFSVPCSKRDVFETKLLSPLDKRRLMTFLQIASDYATAMTVTRGEETTQIGKNRENLNASSGSNLSITMSELKEEAVTSLNERMLQQGRSLYRPQNKTVATNDFENLQKSIEDNSCFMSYLKDQKLSDSLITIIIYAMAMVESDCTTSDGMKSLCQHLLSLGRFGATAFLVPMYGSGELPQAFCRSAAVHGGTYILRRGAESVQLNDSGDVIGVNIHSNDHEDGQMLSPKLIHTSNCILPSNFLPDFMTVNRKRVHRRISIVRGQIIPNNIAEGFQEQRHVIVVPPGEEFVRNKDVIYGIILDESSQVAPLVDGRDHISIIHLITFRNVGESDQRKESETLSRTIEQLINKGGGMMDGTEELFHTDFSYDIVEASQTVLCNKGLHVCERHEPSLTVESSFIEAKKIFHNICPDAMFLKLSDAMDCIVKERRMIHDEDDDDEFKLLESAMNMMKTT